MTACWEMRQKIYTNFIQYSNYNLHIVAIDTQKFKCYIMFIQNPAKNAVTKV